MRKSRYPYFLLFIFILILFTTASCNLRGGSHDDQNKGDTLALAAPLLKFGLPVDSFQIAEGVVRPNQNLSHILSDYGVEMGTIHQIAIQSKEVFDVRKIRHGKYYSVFQSPDSLSKAKYFIYEDSPVDYYVFELFDSLKVYRGEKEVERRVQTASGIIESSLWNALAARGLNPFMALRFSDIYQWSIDFYAIQKGDRFRVIYDELFVDSASIGIGDIYAVQFDHYNNEYYAFRFFQDDRYDYFDDQGNSLRKAFLKAPLEFARVSSRFSHSRMHPVLRIRRPHHGVDYAAPKGTPVVSIGDGIVVSRAYQAGGGGNYLKIKHNSVYTTVYMHLSGFAKGVTQGSRVNQGQVIGYVGATGLATGPHLDFRVYKNGTPVDPLKVEAPPVEPVHEIHRQKYMALKDSLSIELQKIQWEEPLLAEEAVVPSGS